MLKIQNLHAGVDGKAILSHILAGRSNHAVVGGSPTLDWSDF